MSGENPYSSPVAEPGVEKQKDPLTGLHSAGMALFLISMMELMISAFMSLVYLIKSFEEAARTPMIDPRILLALALIGCLRSLLILVSAVCMRHHRRYALAITGAIFASIGPISAPFGVWAFIALLRKDTRAAFAEAS